MSDFLSADIFGLMTARQLLVIVHLFGLAIGAGAAFYSDFLFTDILKDKKIDKTEYRILKLTSKVVWLGLSVLIVSGIIIFLNDSERLLAADKFLAKMSIVAVLAVNGVIFHIYQIPMLGRFVGKDLSQSKTFMAKHARSFFIGGAVSGVSWAAALILGSLSSLDMSYFSIMGIYSVAIALAVLAGIKLKRQFLG